MAAQRRLGLPSRRSPAPAVWPVGGKNRHSKPELLIPAKISIQMAMGTKGNFGSGKRHPMFAQESMKRLFTRHTAFHLVPAATLFTLDISLLFTPSRLTPPVLFAHLTSLVI